MHEQLTAEKLRSLLAYDASTGVFTWLVTHHRIVAGDIAGQGHPEGYWQITIEGRKYLAHRLAWLYVHGEWPKGELDHENLDRCDNRLGNLRPASRAQNSRNTAIRSTNTSGFKGVSFVKAELRWRATITVDGKQHYLGRFDAPEDAHDAYVEAAARFHGEFARAA